MTLQLPKTTYENTFVEKKKKNFKNNLSLFCCSLFLLLKTAYSYVFSDYCIHSLEGCK